MFERTPLLVELCERFRFMVATHGHRVDRAYTTTSVSERVVASLWIWGEIHVSVHAISRYLYVSRRTSLSVNPTLSQTVDGQIGDYPTFDEAEGLLANLKSLMILEDLANVGTD